ncbi:MAG: T9SS type A sorting domain-containing protein, partial [Gemmatimonadetes bacterium]|nr:T9SS type A sorting domain-containing protein [Gemmatimonadota bacterium]
SGSSATVPFPPVLATCDINDTLTSATSEPWEGVLVQAESLIVSLNGTTVPPTSFGQWQARPFPAPTCGIDDEVVLDDEGYVAVAVPDSGDTLLRIIGVLDYHFDRYKLMPRDNNDVVFLGLPPAPNTRFAYPISDTEIQVVFDRGLEVASASNAANYFISTFDISINGASIDSAGSKVVTLTTSDMSAFRDTMNSRELTVQNVANDQGVAMTAPNTEIFVPGVKNCELVQTNVYPATDSTLLTDLNFAVAGIVTATPTEAFGKRHMFIQDRTGFGYGLDIETENLSSEFDPTLLDQIQRGDSVIVAGVGNDFFNFTSIDLVDHITIVSTANTVPAPAVVSVVTARTEAYEGKLIRIEGVNVTNILPDAPSDFGEWVFTEGLSDTMRVDDVFSPGYEPYVPTLGDSFAFVTGVMYNSFSNNKMLPRAFSDLGPGSGSGFVGVDDATPSPFKTALLGNNPNPFNPMTRVQFSLARKGLVELTVYDIRGRAVRTLSKEVMEAGEYTVANGRALTWDGRDNNGREVSSGIYFYNIQTEDFSDSRKMVLVK